MEVIRVKVVMVLVDEGPKVMNRTTTANRPQDLEVRVERVLDPWVGAHHADGEVLLAEMDLLEGTSTAKVLSKVGMEALTAGATVQTTVMVLVLALTTGGREITAGLPGLMTTEEETRTPTTTIPMMTPPTEISKTIAMAQ